MYYGLQPEIKLSYLLLYCQYVALDINTQSTVFFIKGFCSIHLGTINLN